MKKSLAEFGAVMLLDALHRLNMYMAPSVSSRTPFATPLMVTPYRTNVYNHLGVTIKKT